MLAVDLDPPHKGANDVALGRPVRPVQPVLDQGGEGLQLADDELEGTGLLGGVLERGGFGLELGDAPAQCREPRLELGFADQPLGVTVDQPADAAAQFRELTLDRLQFGPARSGAQDLQTALVLSHDAGWLLEQLADLAPDRLVEALDPDGSGVAPALAINAVPLRPGAAVVVVAVRWRARVAPLPKAAERAAADLTDHQALQQVARARHALAPAAPVLVQLLPHALEQHRIDQGRGRDGDVVLGRSRDMAGWALGDWSAAARRTQRRPPWGRGGFPEQGLADVGGVRQQGPDRAAAPLGLASRAGHAGLEQPPAHRGQADALLADPAEDAADHLGLALGHLEARRPVPCRAAEIAVAVGRPGQHADRAGLGQMALASAAALGDARPLVFGEHALQLQQQSVLRRLPDRAVEEYHLGPGARELLDQHRLMRVRAGQAVGRVHVDDVDGRHRREVAQALQSWPDQARAAVAAVEEAQLGRDLVAIRGRARQQRLNLAVDGVALSLLIGRHPRVDRRPDRGHEPYPRRGRRLPLHHSPPLSSATPGQGGPGATASAGDAGKHRPAPPARPGAARSPPPG